MAIYRGNGGAGDATGGVTINEVTALTQRAEDAAVESETSATNSATSASSSATSATAAATSATNSATSASQSATSATNSANSATASATSATNSANSATASASSATASAASATDAASSATDAQTAQVAAETAQTASEAAQAAAATSASNAATSASSASTSASNAASSATASASSATASASSATDSANSATASANSATASASSASSAASSAAAAAASLDSFDDRYLGAKASAPTLDNDGNALVTGALYYDTTEGGMFVYDGAQWIAASSASQAILTVYKFTATSGQTTFTGVDDNAATLSYTTGSIIVTLNGIFLEGGDDYTATDGVNVVLSAGATTSDEVNIYAFNTFDVANVQAIGDDRYVRLTTDQTVAGTKTLSSNPVLSAGTANGVTYLNGSKVLTSGGALTFDGTNFATTGTVTSGGSYNFNTTAGRDILWGTGSYTYITGNPSTGVMAFGIASSELMRLTSTGLGIGTSSPGYKLQLNSGSAVDIETGVSNSVGLSRYGTRGSGNAFVGAFTAGKSLELWSAGAQNAVLDSSGNLGIGTSSPASKLHVDNGTGSALYVGLANNIYSRGSEHIWQSLNNASEYMRLNSAGNLGLGVTPSGWGATYKAFQAGTTNVVSGIASQTDNFVFHNFANAFYDGTNWKYIASQEAGRYELARNVHKWFTAPSGTAGAAISFTQAMTLDASGNLGIGTTSPNNGLVPGLVIGNGTDNKGITLFGTSTTQQNIAFTDTAGAQQGLLQYDHGGDYMRFFTSSTERMRIDSAGRVTMPYQPAFCGFRSAGPVGSTGGTTYYTYIADAAQLNRGSHYNTSNGVFTCPVAGVYRVSFFTMGQTANADGVFASVYGRPAKNGSGYGALAYNYGDGYRHISGTWLISCAANDTLEMMVVDSYGGYSQLCIELVG